MKKIGILTFHRANNYGALLQAYALKIAFQSLGYDVKIINYLCPEIENGYKFFSGKKSIIWFIKRFFKLFFAPLVIINNNKFNNFRRKFLFDTKIVNSESINELNIKFDFFITGSDQVFNPFLTGFDKNYFLDFVQDKNKCFSYAASFGLNYKSLKEEEKIFIKQNLKNFSYLSLREQQGIDIVDKLSNIKSEIHIDPSLLLNRKDWEKIAEIPRVSNFVLVYLMDNNKRLLYYAKELAKKKKLKIKIITMDLKSLICSRNTVAVSPEEWIGYFFKAKYIITNSFHGLAFCINLNKQFFVDFIPNNKFNSRLENLLNLTNLKDRLIDNIGIEYDKSIDWDSVNKIIDKERENSINYIKEITK